MKDDDDDDEAEESEKLESLPTVEKLKGLLDPEDIDLIRRKIFGERETGSDGDVIRNEKSVRLESLLTVLNEKKRSMESDSEESEKSKSKKERKLAQLEKIIKGLL